jgi:hypothetical protein
VRLSDSLTPYEHIHDENAGIVPIHSTMRQGMCDTPLQHGKEAMMIAPLEPLPLWLGIRDSR